MTISITNPTGRQTEARAVHMGKLTLWFSYNTCIAFQYNDYKYRLPKWMFSNTTRRHMSEMGLLWFPQLDSRDFNPKLDTAISLYVSDINRDE